MTQLSQALLEKMHSIEAHSQHQEVFSLKAPLLTVDLSRHYLTKTQCQDLTAWLEEHDFKARIAPLFDVNHLNFTENRSVDHVLLRDPQPHDFLTASAEQQTTFAKRFALGEIKGFDGQAITDLLVLGIGGSHLGPNLVVDALSEVCRQDLGLHFLSGPDPYTLKKTLRLLKPESTLVFVLSKSWSTLETMVNFEHVKQWFAEQAGPQKLVDHFKQHFFAITSQAPKAVAAGFELSQIFTLSESIGGRYSLWSAIGFPMRLMLGETHFHALMHGAHRMDCHFKEQPLAENVPVLLALLDFYYGNCCNIQQRAVIPYTQQLRLLVDHLQQLEMESNGKSIDQQGNFINHHSGLAVWGGVAPNSQHSFHQWFYQGTFCVPIDFIALDQNSTYPDLDQLMLSECLAQSKAMWEGQQSENPPQRIHGGKPSTIMILEELTPESLGGLIALYEHKAFVMGLLSDTNAFDQFGVELGKKLIQPMLTALKQDSIDASIDPITTHLLSTLKS